MNTMNNLIKCKIVQEKKLIIMLVEILKEWAKKNYMTFIILVTFIEKNIVDNCESLWYYNKAITRLTIWMSIVN